MSSDRSDSKPAPGAPAALWSFLAAHPEAWLSALALAAATMFTGWLSGGAEIVAGRRPDAAPLVAWAAAAAVAAVLFYGRTLKQAFDLATADVPGLAAIGAGGGSRLLAQLAVVVALLAPAGLVAGERVPAPVLLVVLGFLAQWLTFFAPQAALIEGLGSIAALGRSLMLVTRHPRRVLLTSLALTLAVALPLVAARAALVASGAPSGPDAVAATGPDAALLFAVLAATLALAALLVIPPVVITALYVGLEPRGALPDLAPRTREVDAPPRGAEAPHAASAADLFNRGMGLISAGQPDRAIELFQAAAEREPTIASGPRYATACLALAETFSRQGQNELAVHYFEAYLENNPHGMNRNTILRRIDQLRAAPAAQH